MALGHEEREAPTLIFDREQELKILTLIQWKLDYFLHLISLIKYPIL